MSKFRNLIGGLAGIGLLTALAIGGVLSVHTSVHTTSSHVVSYQADSATAYSGQSVCLACVQAP
jgi:hypothetical protein